eukprot:45472-Pleurochrysis_carterae.AAC.1
MDRAAAAEEGGVIGDAPAAFAPAPAFSKAKKVKPIFQPEVGQVVLARWMAGKKHEIPRNGGR